LWHSSAFHHKITDLAVKFGAYDQSTALKFVYLSAAAYCDNSTLQSWSCEACKKVPVDTSSIRIHYNGKEELSGFTAKMQDGSGLVSFRGTVPSDLPNWVENLKSAFHTDYPYSGCNGCQVADGFDQAYDLLRPGVLASLKAMGLGPGSRVHLTGHSLGAAMAGLCAFDLNNLGYQVTGYTFGQPRDGDARYSKTFAQNFPSGTWYRVTHNADIVVHLPPEFLGFQHTDTEVWYNEDSTSYTVCDGSGEDSKCSDSVDLPISIEDHLHYLNVPISRSC